MSLHVHILKPFDHHNEQQLLDEVATVIRNAVGATTALLVSQFEAEGVVFPALLVTPQGVVGLQLLPYGGEISAETNGEWTADGHVVRCPSMTTTPVARARQLVRSTSHLCKSWTAGRCLPKTAVWMVFPGEAVFRSSATESVPQGSQLLHVADLGGVLSEWLTQETVFTTDFLRQLPQTLCLTEAAAVPSANDDGTQSVSGYQESADDIYSQLEAIVSGNEPIDKRYAQLRNLFIRLVDQGVRNTHINFAGTFAKLDYLVKEHNVPDKLVLAVNDTRHTLNHLADNTDKELAQALPYDVKSIALLTGFLLRGSSIPATLRRHFLQGERKRRWGKFNQNCLRCIVEHWDDAYIYVCEEENGSHLTVCYGNRNIYLSRDGQYSWSYLSQIMREGATLNLVRLRWEEDVCMPELIIFEPDYLVNITTVASCFESYAESPFVALVNKLKPPANTLAIQLGNLAGQYLDDVVHNRHISFNEGMTQFFQKHALQLLVLSRQEGKAAMNQFYKDAKNQQKNIEKLLLHDLPEDVKDYDAEEVLLEPAFFSNVLGIQGRLDFLTEEAGKVLVIEQKSGKGAFVPYAEATLPPDTPAPQERHLVQVLLYRALFAYQFQKHAFDLQYFFLLYSKYANGLVSTGQRPKLLLNAIKMRNLLAWCEWTYANEGMRFLEQLTPESLNRNGLSSRLWTQYVRPQLAAVLSPIHEASPLERNYFFRFMRFLEKEHQLAAIGNKLKTGSGFASLWLDSLSDKKAAGNIYDRLSLEAFETTDAGVESVSLLFDKEAETDTSNFRRGDIVVLYRYPKGTEPQACRQTVVRATIKLITTTGVELALRNRQTDPKVFTRYTNNYWAIEHDMFESSQNTLYSAMHGFLSATKERRDLLLCQRQPRVDETYLPLGEYHAFNPLVARAKQARDLFLIIGPPGTGKTSFGLLNLLKEELLEQETNILLLSYTNRAVDEICSKLVESHIDFLRIGSELSCDPAYKDWLLNSKTGKLKRGSEVEQLLAQTRVVCGTTVALNASSELFSLKHFHLAIVDEASQILEPHLIGLLSAHNGDENAIDRFVLIGDHKQLPAVVQQSEDESLVTEPDLRHIHLTNCRYSLFERLLKGFKTTQGYDPRYVYMLTRQGRMHTAIADFPSRQFYEGKLQIVPLAHQQLQPQPCASANGITRILSLRNVAFVDAPAPESSVNDKTNQVEAEMIAATIHQIYLLTRSTEKGFSTDHTVGVIVPYRNQIATIRGAIDRLGIAVLHNILIDTVERFQGSQKDYIVYGFTIQRPYQLDFLTSNVFVEDGQQIDRKLNVAMTRARLHLLLIGNSRLLKKSKVFAELLSYLRQQQSYFAPTPEDYCNGKFSLTD